MKSTMQTTRRRKLRSRILSHQGHLYRSKRPFSRAAQLQANHRDLWDGWVAISAGTDTITTPN